MVAAVSAMPNPKRPPLLTSDADSGEVLPRRPKSREVSSRYLSSPSPSSTTTSTSTSATSSSSYASSSNSSSSRRRNPSPLVSRTVPPMTTRTPAPSAEIKRSQSAERRRPAVTPRPNIEEMSAAAKFLVTSRRSLSVSFQGESFSLPISKAKPAPATGTNNLSSTARRGTPERRKLTPVMENSKSVDHQHRWPGRLRDVNSLTRSLDCTSEKTTKLGGSGRVVSRALQQSMVEENDKASFNGRLKVHVDAISAVGSTAISDSVASYTESDSFGSTGCMQERVSVAQGHGGPRGIAVPARCWQEPNNRLRGLPEVNVMKKSFIDSPISSPKRFSNNRGSSSPLRGAFRPASPSKLLTSSASSPSGRMPSPSQARNGVASLLNNNSSSTRSILSFAAEVRRGKVGENRIVDAHLLRLLYNRQLQWRFVNARVDAAMLVQRVTAEMPYLDDWDLIDEDDSRSLSGAIEALESSTVRLPVVGGARADIQNLKDAICSAVDVMQAMASSIFSFSTKVDGVNSLASELANVTSTERALLDQCKGLLSTLTCMQVKDCSLRTHILQLSREP